MRMEPQGCAKVPVLRFLTLRPLKRSQLRPGFTVLFRRRKSLSNRRLRCVLHQSVLPTAAATARQRASVS
jgi:hypothetical protein